MRPLALLLQLSDSALPTGGFSHSYGFEHYIQTGEIDSAESFSEWLRAYVGSQLTYTDALLMRMYYEGVGEEKLADLAVAIAIPAQVRAADEAVAKRIRAISVDALGVPEPQTEATHPAIEFARTAKHFEVGLDDAVTAHLTGTVGSLTQNAVRGIPIGQAAGQRVLVAAHEWVEQARNKVAELDYADLGMIAPGIEIAQMQHESLRARMFMS